MSESTAVAVRERPILFSGEMVRALLDGRKTQTRRVVKGTALEWLAPGMFAPEYVTMQENGLCPYGRPGDRLWVREAWQFADWTEDGMPYVRFQADSAVHLYENTPYEWGERLTDIWADLSGMENYDIDGRAADRRWRPSIHMPRWASRITLEITEVRVERVRDISASDARAEGISTACDLEPRECFRDLWDSINGPRGYGWTANPWVWVVTFKRV